MFAWTVGVLAELTLEKQGTCKHLLQEGEQGKAEHARTAVVIPSLRSLPSPPYSTYLSTIVLCSYSLRCFLYESVAVLGQTIFDCFCILIREMQSLQYELRLQRERRTHLYSVGA